jgi:hypothetical protein
MLDTPIQKGIWLFYKAGQEDRKDPSAGYMIVQAIAVGYVAVNSHAWTKQQNEEHCLERIMLFAPKLSKEELQRFWVWDRRVAAMLELVRGQAEVRSE